MLEQFHPLALECTDEDNIRDMEFYLRHKLPSLLAPEASLDDTVTAMAQKVKGLFVYVRALLTDVESGTLDAAKVNELPNSLDELYFSTLSRKIISKELDLETAKLVCKT
jgi:hypothetical protein